MNCDNRHISRTYLSRFLNCVKRCKRDRSGTTAVEFAMVATPFFALVFVIMQIGLIYFGMFALDNAVEQASRLVRTGQAGVLSESQFKEQICLRLASFMDCGSSIRVGVQSNADLGQITSPSGIDGNGDLLGDGDLGYSAGVGSDYVLVTVFYKWDFIATLPFIDFGNMTDGSLLIRSQAAFRNEPF